MKILFLGDIVGRTGRDAVAKYVPKLRQDYALDCVIANAENAAAGFGINGTICRELYQIGVDVITTGNHIWDQKEVTSYINQDAKLLRPMNYPAHTPGQGATVFITKNNQKILVLNVMGRVFMEPMDDPFAALDRVLNTHVLGQTVDAIVIDVHAEAASEKMAIGHGYDGRVSLVVGTHTHIPTADAHVLPKGTAYQTDAGMCGDYDSVIGMDIALSIARMQRRQPSQRLKPADCEPTLCGVIVELNAEGHALKIEPVRLGPWLMNHQPAFT